MNTINSNTQAKNTQKMIKNQTNNNNAVVEPEWEVIKDKGKNKDKDKIRYQLKMIINSYLKQ